MKNRAIHVTSPLSTDAQRAVDLLVEDPSRDQRCAISVTIPKAWAYTPRNIEAAFDPDHAGASALFSEGERLIVIRGLDFSELQERLELTRNWLPLPPTGYFWTWNDDDMHVSVSRAGSDVFVFEFRFSALMDLAEGTTSASSNKSGVVHINAERAGWWRFHLPDYVRAWEELLNQVKTDGQA